MQKKILTLCIAQEGDKVLLAMKKRGFGVGKWNGLGGKVNEGETIEEGAKREAREEAGIEIEAMEEVGKLDFEWENGEVHTVHIFKITKFSGMPTETKEMKPQWFNVSDIPFDSMWPDDRYWLPLVLQGKKVKGYFLFGEKDSILKQELATV